ncbi:hypothetical protein [Domibacillus epiphyticus]|nr:hypothetical protein [Domibacillus epiphyticus]
MSSKNKYPILYIRVSWTRSHIRSKKDSIDFPDGESDFYSAIIENQPL